MTQASAALALALGWALGMASGCCSGPPPRRNIGLPVFDSGPDTPFVWPFDAGPFDVGRLDGSADARMDAPPASDGAMGDVADDTGDGASMTDAAEDAAAEDAPPFDAADDDDAPDDDAPDDAAGD